MDEGAYREAAELIESASLSAIEHSMFLSFLIDVPDRNETARFILNQVSKGSETVSAKVASKIFAYHGSCKDEADQLMNLWLMSSPVRAAYRWGHISVKKFGLNGAVQVINRLESPSLAVPFPGHLRHPDDLLSI